jgi:hypothetical protein
VAVKHRGKRKILDALETRRGILLPPTRNM